MDNGLGSILSDQTEAEPEVVEQTTEAEAVDTGETTASPAETREEDPIEKHRKGLEAGIAAERQRRQQAEQRAQQLEQQLREREPKPAPQADAGIARPKRDEYESQEAYEDALLEYGDRRREARTQQERKQQEEREHIANFDRQASETVAKGQAQYADFDTVINTGLGPFLNPVMQQALVLGGGHEVAYWLGKNPAEAQRVSQMSPMAMVLEIGRLEAKVKGQEPEPKPSIPQTLTQARDARTGQFKPTGYDGPTPLDDIFKKR